MDGSRFAPPAHASPKPFNRAPAAAPHTVASALKVKNFRRLIDALGEEQLAVRLDLTLQRVKEMGEGINLSDEIAYHIENALGLQSGFIDQVNPMLSSDDVLRLKSPLSEPKVEEPRIRIVRDTRPALVASPGPTPAAAAPLTLDTKEPSMPSKPATGSGAVAQSSKPQAASAKEERQRQIRRDNLQLLTTQPGTKTALGRLTGLSAANVSHRLHGNKIFDDLTAVFFCETLGLPKGWFEVPQSEKTIPADTLKMLLDKDSVAHASSVPAKPVLAPKAKAATPVPAVPTNLAPTKAREPAVAAAAPSAPRLSGALLGRAPGAPPPTVSRTNAPAAPAVSVKRSTPAPALVRAPAAPVQKAAPVAPAPALARIASPVARVAPAAVAPALAPTSMVGPITEALMRTLALKSQEGKLSEERALQLLVDVAAF